jgi:branched-chain amino acid transport system permease protein
MRFEKKHSHWEDIRLFRYRSNRNWYILAIAGALLLPVVLGNYLLSQCTFIYIYSMVTVGLMLLMGFTGQISLGHAAFFGIGAYTAAISVSRGMPFIFSLPLAGVVAGLFGIVVGLPALRLSRHSLAIATMGMGFIVEEIIVRWEGLTNGNKGFLVDPPDFFGVSLETETRYYYLCLIIFILGILSLKNILRTPTGRALIAIRDSEVASQAIGINLPYYKTLAFAFSAFLTGIAGGLYAFKLTFISPESFTILLSIEFLAMIIIGGLGSVHGAVFGATFLILLPQLIMVTKDYLPKFAADQRGFETAIYGLMIMLFIRFEPMGLYGRWVKIKYYFEMYPFYKKDTFKRGKKYFKAEGR